MSRASNERIVYRIATIAVVLGALATLIVDSEEVEVTLFMATAVVAGLLCFDTSMNRRLRSFAPWALLSLAPALKTVPAVWFQVRSESGLLFERYDHAGSLLFGACVLAAVVVLSRPAPTLGREVALSDTGVIAGSAIISGLAGASVAFLFDRDFGSATAGRILESPTWVVIGALLAATALAAGHAPRLSPSLTIVLTAAAATGGLLALSVAGRDFDRGWWAILYAAFAVSAYVNDAGPLGVRNTRDRRTNAGVTVATLAGVVAAAAAISARSDRTSWGPGWALLGAMSLAMLGAAYAMASRSLDTANASGSRQARDHAQDIGRDDTARAAHAKARALKSLETSVAGAIAVENDAKTSKETQVGAPALPQKSKLKAAAATGKQAAGVDQAAAARATPAKASAFAELAGPDEAKRPPIAPITIPRSDSKPAPVDKPAADTSTAVQQEATQSRRAVSNNDKDAAIETPAEGRTGQNAQFEPPPESTDAARTADDIAEVSLSDAGIVASARAAAEVRTAPLTQRHSLAPLAQAHHFDPSTGLLSAAGLQHAIIHAFDVPRKAGHVTIMMFTIRDLDRIERQHGRLASAAVTREVAERIRVLLPAGAGARFGRSAYAIIFVGDLSNASETVQRLARVLLRLRAPVESGTFGDKIDVVASMAQCYDREDAADFVKRANTGLARAVQTTEPTFVAMP